MINLSRKAAQRAFERAAGTYDDAAVLQREIADRLLERLDYIKEFSPTAILDLGCGTGYCHNVLKKKYSSAEVIGLDLALPMLTQPGTLSNKNEQRSLVCADAERLPLADNSMDLVISNLTLQWCNPVEVFEECNRILRPGGLFMFTTFGPDTLKELRQAWNSVDKKPHVHDFIDIHDLGDILASTNYQDPVMDTDLLVMTYPDVPAVLRDLKAIGAHNVAVNRERGLTGKTLFNRFRSAYEAWSVQGKIPATYEVVYGHSRVLENNKGGSELRISVDEIGRPSG